MLDGEFYIAKKLSIVVRVKVELSVLFIVIYIYIYFFFSEKENFLYYIYCELVNSFGNAIEKYQTLNTVQS